MTGNIELIGLICTWNFGAFSAVPSPIIKKTSDVKHLYFFNWIGTSSTPEITEQEMEAGEQKGNMDFTCKQGDGSKFVARKSSGTLFLVIQN